eukprot:scaffold170234_cov18-Tisochrysis_lutea.AAC.1
MPKAIFFDNINHCMGDPSSACNALGKHALLAAMPGTFGGPSGKGNDPDFRVLSASTDGTMRVWDPYDMSCARVMHQEFSEISAMAFHEVKDIMVTGLEALVKLACFACKHVKLLDTKE